MFGRGFGEEKSKSLCSGPSWSDRASRAVTQGSRGRAIVDPDLFGRRLARWMFRGGRPKGSLRAYKNHKLVEAPLLHRDPSAPEKLLSCER